MKIRFWGTRGSIPAPICSEEIEEKICQAILALPDLDTNDINIIRACVRELPPMMRGTAGGNSPCIEIRAGEQLFVADAGSGIYPLGQELMKGPFGRGEGTMHLFISHPHWDHIHGFPMFTPAFVPGNRILIYGVHNLAEVFEGQQKPVYWPVPLSKMTADVEFISLNPGDTLDIGPVHISIIQNTHPGDAYGYRFEGPAATLVYAADNEFKELDNATLQPYLDFFRDADALVFDAQYTLREAWEYKANWGHSSAMIGVDVAQAAGVKRLFLFHHDPTYSDHQLLEIQQRATNYQAQNFSPPHCQIIVACEGMTVDLAASESVDMQITPDGDAAILTPAKTLDQHGVDQVIQQLERLGDRPTSSIIDLSTVETLTTSIFKSLVSLRRHEGSPPIVLAAPSERVRKVIKLGGYEDYFAIYPSLEAALLAVRAREALNLPGHVIDNRYQIEGKLGETWHAVILQASDLQSDRQVILKVLSPSFSPETIERVMHQAQRILSLNHRNIVKILAWEKSGVRVEEQVVGRRLLHLIEANALPLPVELGLDIGNDIASALEYAHSRGVIHGNLRPSNILFTEEGIKLTDFGLSLLIEGRTLPDDPFLPLLAPYLAPEQIMGEPLDARTDLYTFGVILYQLLTGQLPFDKTGVENILDSMDQAPIPPRELNPRISLSLEHLLLKLLNRNPNDRYANAQQVRRVLGGLSAGGEEVVSRRHTPLVGRDEPLQILLGYWQEARAGRGQMVFITGESGIGKTSLVQQLALQSRAPVQLMGQSHESAERSAYHLFAEILRAYFATVPPEFSEPAAHPMLTNLSRLIPELGEMLPELPKPPPLEPVQEKLRLITNLAQFVRHATSRRPWLLIFDDLQWADPSSLEMLRCLGRYLSQTAVLVVGTYRDIDLEPGHALLDVVRDLNRHPACHHLALDRLSEKDVGQIFFNIWHQPLPPALVERIYQHTAGNPFYIEEVIKGLEDDGLITMQKGEWRFPNPEALQLPATVREAVWQRIERLSPDTQTLLSQAAVLGQTFRFQDLLAMSGLPEWQVLEQLDIALERQLVQEEPGKTTLSFRHTEIQHVLYQDLGPLRRRMLHRQAAKVLEQYPRPERSPEELAHHLRQAGEIERAIAYSIEAAHQAHASYANEAAILWYKQTLEMLEQIAPEERTMLHPLRFSTHQSLGQVLALVGRYEEALEEYDQAQSLLVDDPHLSHQPGRQADLCRHVAEVYERRAQYDLAFEWLEKGLAHLDKNEPTLELVRNYDLSGWVCLRQGNYEAAQPHLERALNAVRIIYALPSDEPARQVEFRVAEASILRHLGINAWYLGDHTGAISYCEQALHIYRQVGDRKGESKALNNLGVFAINRGDYAEGQRYHEQALAIYRETGDRQGESSALGNLGVTASFLGDYPAARDYYEQTLQICREISDRRGETNTLINLGIAANGLGDHTQAMEYSQQALKICRSMSDRLAESLVFDNLGTTLDCLGSYQEAREYYQQALNMKREIGFRDGEGETLARLALLCHHLGDNKAAQSTSEKALFITRETENRTQEGHALLYLGHALAGEGHLAEAVQAYQQSLDMWRELERPNMIAECRAALARAALAQDDLPWAVAQVEQVLDHLKGNSLDGTNEPIRIYLTCYHILRADQDPRAETILETAHSLLQERAAWIEQPELRQSFLENVAAHRALRGEFAQERRDNQVPAV
ncbi:MAG: tetratricopeptide repeat protein [Anaerolineae bacterium]|nr:tetratricopeptide repeat protein [Anaerolineae bacterium]